MSAAHTVRLLPWYTPAGKPCYLSTDESGGYLSRKADQVEAIQLGMGNELLSHAESMLAESKVTAEELSFLATHLIESLRDVLRIAESRGKRLPVPDSDDFDESDAADDRPQDRE
ncbi:hypothetical protein HRW07_03900 [Streptomyces lunaelactis]|uniref:hypothetical protein n=1 Tax=Streptomyces lunaelactis TaxID=1535768 RepID=UPI00158500EE|nr:hypothetical protein [Streptomyces lunaelactis]NUL02403.1 hypothetical protein [Streptomyces lunaelactis]